jgi:MFS transporter, PAT family, beta-lactamase induction signal transducer AmpG
MFSSPGGACITVEWCEAIESMASPSRAPGWRTGLAVYAEPPVARMLLLGFSAGLPLPLVLGTLSYRLREAGIDRTTIGFFSWVALAYAFKWAWAPLVDRVPLPVLTRVLGRRRSWLLLAQSAIAFGLIGMAFSDPARSLTRLVAFALFVAFSSATQDIALDAFRIESAERTRQAAMAAAYQVGYRAAMITASAGALWIAAAVDTDESTYQHLPWNTAYLCMAGAVSVGIVTVLFSRERAVEVSAETLAREQGRSWLYRAVASPVLDFVYRYRWRAALLLALIAVYRISDIILGVMSNPFYRDMGFSKDEVAIVSGVYGVVMTLVGAGIGGILALRVGVVRVLILGATLSSMTNLLFAWLTTRGHDLPALVAVISADNLSTGIASAAFVAFLSSLTNVAYSATQYATFSSLMVLLPKFLAGWSGWVVDHHGYCMFFIGTAVIGLPVIVLAWLASRLA